MEMLCQACMSSFTDFLLPFCTFFLPSLFVSLVRHPTFVHIRSHSLKHTHIHTHTHTHTLSLSLSPSNFLPFFLSFIPFCSSLFPCLPLSPGGNVVTQMKAANLGTPHRRFRISHTASLPGCRDLPVALLRWYVLRMN